MPYDVWVPVGANTIGFDLHFQVLLLSMRETMGIRCINVIIVTRLCPLIVTLIRHTVRHSVEKPHQCRFGEVIFPVNGVLVRHMTIE